MVVQRPFSRYTLPVYSLVGRTALDRAARSAYGDADMSDTWIPCYCTSSDIHAGEKVVHRMGPMWKAVRASTSVPGIAPPVIDGSRLLVDGAVLDNLPEQDMIEFCGGEIIAVDVSPGDPIPIDCDYDDLPSPWKVVRSRLNPFRRVRMRIPSLLEVMVRVATVSDKGQRAQLEQTVDLVLRPPVHSFGLLEFTECDRIIDVSYAYSRQRLEEWWAGRQKAAT
jgi:predicted acylesterase/phospholipase RssA